MALPFLPGNSFNKNLGKEKYHKSHYFDLKNDVNFLFGDDKVGIGGDPLPGQRIDAPRSHYPNGDGANVPAWVAFDKQVLSFDAFYQEAVNEKREEQYRIRPVKIYFYLEDDSIQVVEPRIKNMGLPQGTLIRRHRIAKAAPNDDIFFTVHDFNVGTEVTLYGKVFRLIGCDEFTQNFLRKMGVKVGPPEKLPYDPYTNLRKAMEESMQPLRPYEKKDTLRQFLDHDRHVLRFYCFWDDTDSLYGDPREMVLHYFLSDDTIEMREVIPANSGRDAAPSFLRRQKLPKNQTSLPLPGSVADRTVLNVFGGLQDGRYILDSLKTGSLNTEFYRDCDLTIGSFINVYGRKFLLTDCDEMTKEYYRTKFGVQDFKPISYNTRRGQPIVREDPPYNGYGSYEDSLGNCKHMIPKPPPQRNFGKILKLAGQSTDSYEMRFGARMDTDKPIDKTRKFIISYFLTDDTIQIYEPPVRNSGVIGGKFLERGRVKKPNQERYPTTSPEYYNAQDFFVGAQLNINNYVFLLEDADEYAYRYMETHPEEFPVADVRRIISKLSSIARQKADQVKDFFNRQDGNGENSVALDQFRCLLKQMTEGQLLDHEIMTLARFYGDRPAVDLNPAQVIGVAQQQLRKHNFENFTKILEAGNHVDRKGDGKIPAEELRVICRTLHLPVPDDLLRALFRVSNETEDCLVDYGRFVFNINWRENPVSPPGESTGTLEQSWMGESGDAKHQVTRIRWRDFLNDVTSR